MNVTGSTVGRWLSEQGHDVYSVYDVNRGIDDDRVLEIAHQERRIIITNDKDFGEKIFREKRPYQGVILLRLSDERSKAKIEALSRLLDRFADRLEGNFVVCTESNIRITK